MKTMKIKEVKVYSYDELDSMAQATALNNWLSSFDYSWGSDNKNTLDAFENIFPVKIRNFEYGGYRGNDGVNFVTTCDDEIDNLSGFRLATYLWNNYKNSIFKGKYYSKGKWINGQYVNKHRHSKIILDNSCVLTGYCMDDDILSPIYNFLKKPDKNTTFLDLLKDCFDSWISACNADYEYATSEEAFKESCEANEYEFYENGDMA
jgi:hypothetical protein